MLGNDLVLEFELNPFVCETYKAGDPGFIRFTSVSRYRFTNINDEGWYLGQCRFSALAPEWGEFYQVTGAFRAEEQGAEWTLAGQGPSADCNFLFYFRDNSFECSARNWSFDPNPGNALRHLTSNSESFLSR